MCRVSAEAIASRKTTTDSSKSSNATVFGVKLRAESGRSSKFIWGGAEKLHRQEDMVTLVKAALVRQSGSGDLVELEAEDEEEYVDYILDQFEQDEN